MADSIQPSFIKQNADGTMAAVFSGGVELNAADSTKSQPPASENSIQWVRQQDGALIAQIYSTVEEPGSVVGFPGFDLHVFDPNSKGAQLYLSAQPDQNTPNRGAAVSVSSGSTGNVGQVSVNAWDANGNESYAHVLKGDGTSDFARTSGPSKTFVSGFDAFSTTVPAQGDSSIVRTAPDGLFTAARQPNNYVFAAYINQSQGGYGNWCAWSVSSINASTGDVTFTLHNFAPAAATIVFAYAIIYTLP